MLFMSRHFDMKEAAGGAKQDENRRLILAIDESQLKIFLFN
jgi:hypothetical protein